MTDNCAKWLLVAEIKYLYFFSATNNYLHILELV